MDQSWLESAVQQWGFAMRSAGIPLECSKEALRYFSDPGDPARTPPEFQALLAFFVMASWMPMSTDEDHDMTTPDGQISIGMQAAYRMGLDHGRKVVGNEEA